MSLSRALSTCKGAASHDQAGESYFPREIPAGPGDGFLVAQGIGLSHIVSIQEYGSAKLVS